MNNFDMLNLASKDVGLEFDEKRCEKFILYRDLIKEWNEKINITAIKDDEGILKKHFIDCIKIFKATPIKTAKSLIDIGTGGGFPGLPIKIMQEDKKVVLLDSLRKRITFLDEVIRKLKLEDINTIHGRAEDFAKDKEHREKYDVAVSRAVANLTVLSEYCVPYVKQGGYFIAMKGPSIDQEILDSKKALSVLGCKIEDIVEVDIEGTDLNHNLLLIKKTKKTDKKYPRNPGIIKKKPLK
ncbi:16S rRNA (guanine(527)-N(7))-methyltransferase RsmG [Clostridium oceanicum]|uniref:Ribosomal RNA small subunit methyltransferase G n=1 Tax=Clostridium oceanicum TaxID=1543 RepID=A0ABN1JSC6_9CLOT